MKAPTDDILADLLGSRTRARLIELLLAPPGSRLHLREIIRRSGLGAGSVQRELSHLERVGILSSAREGSNRVFFAAGHPFEPELRSLVAKSGAGHPVRAAAPAAHAALARLNPSVREKVPALLRACERHHVVRAAVFGSAADPAPGVTPRDLDVLVTFGDVPPGMHAEDYFGLLEELQEIMGMPVDVVVSEPVRNPYLQAEIVATEVVVYEAA